MSVLFQAGYSTRLSSRTYACLGAVGPSRNGAGGSRHRECRNRILAWFSPSSGHVRGSIRLPMWGVFLRILQTSTVQPLGRTGSTRHRQHPTQESWVYIEAEAKYKDVH